MRFFDLDLHVSVIEDVAWHLRNLGHTVDSHLMSGHNWALGRPKASMGNGPGLHKIGYGSVNLATWESLFDKLVDGEYAQVKAWQEENKHLDGEYDGFIATYPPAFALLYEKFAGKVIIDAAIRYELHFTERPELWRDFNERLHKMQDAGRLRLVANSRYDAAYIEYFSGLKTRRIPSLCAYIDEHTPKCTRRGTKFLAFGDHPGARECAKEFPNEVFFVRDILQQYRHDEIIKAKGVVWFPYNVNAMSFFEQYWLEIPLFVPSMKFMVELRDKGLAGTQMTWHRNVGGGSNLPAFDNSLANHVLGDPNGPDGFTQWMRLWDFYDNVEFPFIIYFDSWADLREKMAAKDYEPTSTLMREHNVKRRASNLAAWKEVVK